MASTRVFKLFPTAIQSVACTYPYVGCSRTPIKSPPYSVGGVLLKTLVLTAQLVPVRANQQWLLRHSHHQRCGSFFCRARQSYRLFPRTMSYALSKPRHTFLSTAMIMKLLAPKGDTVVRKFNYGTDNSDDNDGNKCAGVALEKSEERRKKKAGFETAGPTRG